MVFWGIIGFRGNNWKIIHTKINVYYIGMKIQVDVDNYFIFFCKEILAGIVICFFEFYIPYLDLTPYEINIKKTIRIHSL